jgi:hypothetical protein
MVELDSTVLYFAGLLTTLFGEDGGALVCKDVLNLGSDNICSFGTKKLPEAA